MGVHNAKYFFQEEEGQMKGGIMCHSQETKLHA